MSVSTPPSPSLSPQGEPLVRFELTTHALRMRCSTPELQRRCGVRAELTTLCPIMQAKFRFFAFYGTFFHPHPLLHKKQKHLQPYRVTILIRNIPLPRIIRKRIIRSLRLPPPRRILPEQPLTRSLSPTLHRISRQGLPLASTPRPANLSHQLAITIRTLPPLKQLISAAQHILHLKIHKRSIHLYLFGARMRLNSWYVFLF